MVQAHTADEPDKHRVRTGHTSRTHQASAARAPSICWLWSWCRWKVRFILEYNFYLFKYSIMSPQACMMSPQNILRMICIAL